MRDILRIAMSKVRESMQNGDISTRLTGPIIVSDSGDNPTAGGVGDVPAMVEVEILKA